MERHPWAVIPDLLGDDDPPSLIASLVWEAEVAERLRRLFITPRPSQLTAVEATWSDYFELEVVFQHADSVSQLELFYGNGYTSLSGPALNYSGWLEPEVAAAVVEAALRGRVVESEEYRFGKLIGTSYMIDAGDGAAFVIDQQWDGRRRIGRRPTVLRSVLRPMVWGREVKDSALSFDRTPAVALLS
jgi:hypothetical protein